MNAQSLKTIIALNLAILLLAAAILIDLIIVATGQKNFIQTRMEKSCLLAAGIQTDLLENGYLKKQQIIPLASFMKTRLDLAGFASAIILKPDGSILYSDASEKPFQRQLSALAAQTLQTGGVMMDFNDKTWGVFLLRHRYLLLSRPLLWGGDTSAAAVGMAVDLAPFYARQRDNQPLILIYGLFNVLLLTFLGTYVVSRAAVKPINRLVKIAEGYREDSALSPFYDKGKNEFRQLSRSLNRMVNRIAEDKHQLQTSLANLENANMEIKKRQHELIRAEKLASVGRLSAGIAHEIGNPIGIVLGYLEMLAQPGLTDTETADYLKRCESEIHRINTIIRELLDFSRPSPQTEEIVAVHDIIKESLSLLEVQPLMKSVTTRLTLQADNDQIYAASDKIRQVFINLLINAADAVSLNNDGQEPIVDIITETRLSEPEARFSNGADWLDIAIKDNGPGIADKDMDSIFDPFYTTKEPGKGTGLGLSVCFMIIEGLEGRIKAESTPGTGTTVTVSLPLANPDCVDNTL
ncbi:MAG: ATP-binding protein [Thermodesulfobacteriota bacterium]|nr:ATP-binding protein [Thermodesulfobacteriota bacterium]